jgi:hypothetical protein
VVIPHLLVNPITVKAWQSAFVYVWQLRAATHLYFTLIFCPSVNHNGNSQAGKEEAIASTDE